MIVVALGLLAAAVLLVLLVARAARAETAAGRRPWLLPLGALLVAACLLGGSWAR